MFCREQAARFNDRLAEIENAGAKVIAIGSGNVEMATDFAEQFAIRFALFTDPSRASYTAAGLVHGFSFGLGVVKSGLRAVLGGQFQGRTQGDPLQQGGVIVVRRDGTPLFVHADATAGDHASIDAVLAALRRDDA